ncbi:MAG: DegV family protein [Oscillospiraceae bacterium]|nr:DegV family protein [Oscillospiraceae bacterium]
MNSNKIVITSDSTADLSPEFRERYSIVTIPLSITLGDKTYSDGVDITPDDIYEYQKKTGLFPKTAAINVDDAINFFKPFVDEGKTVIHFGISSEMSSSYNNCRLAAEEVGNVYVIDNKNLSTGTGLLVLAAAQMAADGVSAEEIVAKINELVPCTDASFVIDELDFLHKGGRCTALEMFGANLLKLKPCIQVKDGKMGVAKKYRGKYSEVLKQYVREKIANPDDIITDRVFVTHSGCDPEVIDSVVSIVKESGIFKEVFLTRAGCTVSSHCGPNTLGVLFIHKSQI